MTITFFVPGLPQPGGSKTAYRVPGTNRIRVVDACRRNGPWRSDVAMAAHQAMMGRPPLSSPLEVRLEFLVQRPRGHFGTGHNAGRVRTSAPAHPARRPDLTKLIRAAEDACTGIVWKDDALICSQVAAKRYTEETPGLRITARELSREQEQDCGSPGEQEA
jgi:Holliday junction resolvase RusA-like endonuclease